MGWDGTSQTVPCRPNGTWGWDGQLGSCSLGGMGWDVPDCPIPSQLDLDHALWVGWDGTSQTVPCHPNGTWGWDGQLGSCSLGGMGWDVPDCPIPSQWYLGMGWTAGIMLSGWDGMGRPRLSRAIPMGLGDGMDSWGHALWVGCDGTSQTVPSHPNRTWIMLSGWDGMGRPRLSHAIPMGLGDGMDSWDHALRVGWDGTSQTVPSHPNWTWIMLSGWDGMGRPRLSHAIPIGLGDGMDSWDHALWVGWNGTSQTVPSHPNWTWIMLSGWDGMGHPRLSHAIPMGLGDGMDSWDHALWVGWDGTSQTVPSHPNWTWIMLSGWDGMGRPRLSHAIPMVLGDGMDSWDHALWVGWDGTSQTVPSHPNGTWGWDGQLGSCSLGGMGWDVPDCPVPSQWDLGMGWTVGGMLSGWDVMGRPRLSHPIPIGLGSCSLGGMGWDVPDCPMPSQWDLGMGWTAGIMLSGWDGMGRPRLSHPIPIGLGSCSLGGMGWDVPDCPMPSQLDLGMGWTAGIMLSGWDGMGHPRLSHPIPIGLGSCSLGGMGWDIPDCPMPSQWDLGMGWTAGIMLSGWDGMGRPRLSHPIPIGLGSCSLGGMEWDTPDCPNGSFFMGTA